MMIAAALRVILIFLTMGHAMLSVGFGLGIGPAKWDPTKFLVRGQPATLEPGMELAFPKILGAFYGALASCLLLASVRFSKDSIQTSTLPCVLYHFGAAFDAAFGDSGIINTKEMDATEPIVAHGVFCTLCLIAFVFAGRLSPTNENDDDATTKGRKDD